MRVYEIFPSIDGEVNQFGQGHLTTFIRLAGCNLNCNYCDTKYAIDINSGKNVSVSSIMDKIEEIGIDKVTITGGEPLLQDDAVNNLISDLYHNSYKITLETNGSIDTRLVDKNCGVVVDYKLPSSGMESFMKLGNLIRARNIVKFVISDRTDYDRAKEVMNDLRYNNIFYAFSPVSQKLTFAFAKVLTDWMIKDKLKNSVLNLQLHKIIDIK